MNLQVSNNRGRKYLSIVRGYWDTETKKVRRKSVESLQTMRLLRYIANHAIVAFQSINMSSSNPFIS
ncbi:MAG: hypothetical protein LBQ86_04135 [Holophagales bacterium]|jgi:hypothetical protein|nr:hypothetical protein [Holophagales bacterium]